MQTYLFTFYLISALYLKSRKSTVLDAMRRNMRPDASNVIRYTQPHNLPALSRAQTYYILYAVDIRESSFLIHICTAKNDEKVKHTSVTEALNKYNNTHELNSNLLRSNAFYRFNELLAHILFQMPFHQIQWYANFLRQSLKQEMCFVNRWQRDWSEEEEEDEEDEELKATNASRQKGK